MADCELPMNVLLSHALLGLTRCCERAGAQEVVLWSNLLRVVGDDGVDRKALPTMVRLSRRAVRSMVDALARHGWAAVDGGVVRLTDVATDKRREWADAISQAEASWPGTSEIRGPLESFVSQLPLEYSHYPCGYGAADDRITGGPGADWKPVARDLAADTVSSVSLLALLSQALVGFAVEYESRVPFGIAAGVYFDAAFGDDPLPLAKTPPALMIAGNGKSGLERHGAVEVDRSKLVTLTARGRQVRDAYRPAVRDVETALPNSAPLRAALETLDVQAADHPDVRYVGGYAGFAEVSARR